MKEQDAATDEEPVAKRKVADYYDEQAIEFILRAMKADKVTPDVLAARLAKLGYERPTPKNLMQRIRRGGFSAGFFLRALKVLDARPVDLDAFLPFTREQERKRVAEHERARAEVRRALK